MEQFVNIYQKKYVLLQVKVALAQVGAIRNNLDESQLQDVITEIVTGALRNTSVHFNLSQFPTCPRFSRNVPTPGQLLPVHYDSIVRVILILF